MKRLRASFTSDSGGLVYHWRAVRYGGDWAPFRQVVAHWLDRWSPRAQQLVLIGPSAGWTLPLPWLGRFRECVVLDPDPLARALLRLRSARPITVGVVDALTTDDGPGELAAAYPDAAFLFANVLGQVLPEDDVAAERRLDALETALSGREWASYHDLASTSQRPCLISGIAPTDADLDSLIRYFWEPAGDSDSPDAESTAAGSPRMLHVDDHRTFRLHRATDEATVWQLTPNQWQLVGWTHRG